MNNGYVIGVYAGIFGGAFLFIWYFYRADKAQKHAMSKKWEEEDDELLYDKLTGRKISVEEAEEGIEVTESDFRRIKTDEEILQNYSGSEQQTELTINYLKKKGYKISDRPIDFMELIGNSAILSHAQYWSWAEEDIFELAPDNFLILSNITRQDNTSDWLAILLITTDREWGHYIAVPATELEQLVLPEKDEFNVPIKGYDVKRYSMAAGEQVFTQLLEGSPPLKRATVEAMGKMLLVFFDFWPSLERADEVIKCYHTIINQRPVRAHH